MKRQELIFFSVFLGTLAILSLFIHSSITGKVVGTAYCDDSGCYEICMTDTECYAKKCCQFKDIGLCMDSCSESYLPTLSVMEIGFEETPILEMPSQNKEDIYVYGLLFLITVVIGHLFYISRKSLNSK